MFAKQTDQEKLSHAESEIRYYDGQINFHDAEASRLRKVRQKFKAQRDRALDRLALAMKASA